MKDSTLLVKFQQAAEQLHSASPEVVEQVHGLMLTKIYNARSKMSFCKVLLRSRV